MSLSSRKERLQQRLADARERWPVLDHGVRTITHFNDVDGSQRAGGVTYFAFLSVFPVLALAFFAVGYVAGVYPDVRDALVTAIDEVLPGLVGDGENEIALTDIQDAAGAVGLVGLAGVLYAGLGWLSALRNALSDVFEEPQDIQPGFIGGKIRDLTSLVVLGVVLLVSVGVSGVVTRISEQVLELMGLGAELGWLLAVLALALGVVASTLLFFLMFRMLARPPTPARALWSGALLGAVGFELLKQLSSLLLSGTKGQPAFQAFGIALILLVWINYFSRVVLYAAAWAHTSPAALAARRSKETADAPAATVSSDHADHAGPGGPAPATAPWRERLEADRAVRPEGPRWAAPFAAGGAAMLALVAVVRRTTKGS